MGKSSFTARHEAPKASDATQKKQKFSLQSLLENEANIPGSLCRHPELVDFQDKNGNTLLHWAAKRENEKLVKLLIAYKASVKIRNFRRDKKYPEGETALDRAQRTNNHHIIYMLKKQGGDVSNQTSGMKQDEQMGTKAEEEYLKNMFNFLEHKTETEKMKSGKCNVKWNELMQELQAKGQVIKDVAGVSR